MNTAKGATLSTPDIRMTTAKGVTMSGDITMQTAKAGTTIKHSGGLKVWEKELVDSAEVKRKATAAQLCESLSLQNVTLSYTIIFGCKAIIRYSTELHTLFRSIFVCDDSQSPD